MKKYLLLLGLVVGCGSSQQFTSIPSGLDKASVPHQSIEMTAVDFHYTPEELRVKEGTLVTLKITSTDGTHGFKLDAFGIDENLEEGQTKVIEFYAAKKGEYGFHCSHFCGIGHFGMSGKIVVE